MIASMDIDKWFPSMKVRPMTKEIKQMIIDSNIEFKEIDFDNASKYLGEKMTIEEILEEEMEDILYLEEEKLNKLMKAKNSVTNDVTSVSEDEKQTKAHKECAEKEIVTKDVASIRKDGRKNKAHK